MKKRILISVVMLFFVVNSNAQLVVDSTGKVGIMTSATTLKHRLTVGDHNFFNNNASIGIAGSPIVGNTHNIGVEGAVSANSSYSSDKNYGVLGVVKDMNTTHGRNYGVSGMIGPLDNLFGGTGVYGTNSTYYYTNPTTIYGNYAGYFDGPVNVSNNLTALGMYTSFDTRLSENIVSLNDRDRGGKETLENVLNMNVVEYNLKGRLSEDLPDDIDPEKAEEVRKSFEVLKKEEEAIVSKRHFGVDAEDLQKIYPDLVLEGQDGYLSVNYSELVPLLVRSIQALKQELDEIKGIKINAKKKSQSSRLSPSDTSNRNILYQNSPNPFKDKTVISFQLATDVFNAAIGIFDMSGKMLKSIPITSEMESVSVSGHELGDGMFFYSLIVNGQEIDTKRMILTK